MTEISRTHTRRVVIVQKAGNGHHLTVHDFQAFADACRAEPMPPDTLVEVDRGQETLHAVGLRATWIRERPEVEAAPE